MAQKYKSKEAGKTEKQKSKEAGKSKSRKAEKQEKQRSRESKMQRSRKAEKQEKQRSRKAEKQKSREAEKQKSRKSEKQESIEPGTKKNQNLPRKKKHKINSPPWLFILGFCQISKFITAFPHQQHLLVFETQNGDTSLFSSLTGCKCQEQEPHLTAPANCVFGEKPKKGAQVALPK